MQKRKKKKNARGKMTGMIFKKMPSFSKPLFNLWTLKWSYGRKKIIMQPALLTKKKK